MHKVRTNYRTKLHKVHKLTAHTHSPTVVGRSVCCVQFVQNQLCATPKPRAAANEERPNAQT
jgi:hypothetical protein